MSYYTKCCVCLRSIIPGENPWPHHWDGNTLAYCHEDCRGKDSVVQRALNYLHNEYYAASPAMRQRLMDICLEWRELR
jgi:hypothetical protein